MTCRTILLRDDTAPRDELGAHQRVADVLIDLFRKDTGGRAIGLEGAWGSGKSSIVDFVRKGLHSDGRFEVVVFDAWAHEGDPLRRSFLEELSDRLKDRQWISARRHQQLRRDLRERRPRLSRGAMFFGISALLVPAGTVLLDKPMDSLWWILGLGLSLSPLAVLLGVLLVGWQTGGDATALMGAVVPNASAASETMGATSIEFAEYFDGLLEASLLRRETSVHPAPGERRLVIVIDNLDRVEGADARAIWRTLQTFVHRRPEPPFDRVWVLVPYDRDRIEDWSHLTPEEEGTDGFLSKSFAARFTVPPPILGDWKKFLLRQLEKAMPDHDKKDWHPVYRAFDARRPSNGQEPTAREIKEFVNAVGTIHRQWGEHYPLAHVACFALARDAIVLDENDPQGEHVLTLPERLQMRHPSLAPPWLLNSTLLENMAGLWFNREASEAVEILLTTGIENAILTGDGEALNQLHDNFTLAPSILEKVMDDLDLEQAQALLVARAIVVSGVAATLPPHERAIIQRTLRRKSLRIETWIPEALHAQGAVALFRFCGTKVSARIFRALNTGLQNLPLGPGAVDGWIANLLSLFRECESIGVPLPERVQLVEGGNDLGAVWLAVMKQDPFGQYWSRFVVKDLTQEAILRDVSKLPSNPMSPPPIDLLAGIVATDDPTGAREWEQIVSKVGEPLLESGNADDLPAVHLLWRVRWIWVLAQHGSEMARVILQRCASRHLDRMKSLDRTLAFGIALEHSRSSSIGPKFREGIENFLAEDETRARFVELLMSWEGGQRIVPYVRATGEYTPFMRENVKEASSRTSRVFRQLEADLASWKPQGVEAQEVRSEIMSDAGLSDQTPETT